MLKEREKKNVQMRSCSDENFREHYHEKTHPKVSCMGSIFEYSFRVIALVPLDRNRTGEDTVY